MAAEAEAAELLAYTHDVDVLKAAVERRASGEPLAWITGRTTFAGSDVRIAPGVYVPRWQTEWVAEAASRALPATGLALDVCCGSGAIAMALGRGHPDARVLGVDIDGAAVDCARANGVDARVGDLLEPVPREWRGSVDVVVAVCPYVPAREAIAATAEPARALYGGDDGLAIVRRLVEDTPGWLASGGALVVEIGAPQFDVCSTLLRTAGFTAVEPVVDGEGDVAGVVARVPAGYP